MYVYSVVRDLRYSQGSVSSGRNWFLPEEWKKLEETSFFQFLPEETEETGRNRKKLKFCWEMTVNNCGIYSNSCL